jgi:hypothetical protein
VTEEIEVEARSNHSSEWRSGWHAGWMTRDEMAERNQEAGWIKYREVATLELQLEPDPDEYYDRLREERMDP